MTEYPYGPFTGARLESGCWAVAAYRPDVVEFIGRHGEDPERVLAVEVDGKTVRMECYRLRDGKPYLANEDDDRAVMEIVERELVGALPGWWTP